MGGVCYHVTVHGTYYEFMSEMTLHENHENFQHDLYLARDSNAIPPLKCILRGKYCHLF
jgi:hypothetical protein